MSTRLASCSWWSACSGYWCPCSSGTVGAGSATAPVAGGGWGRKRSAERTRWGKDPAKVARGAAFAGRIFGRKQSSQRWGRFSQLWRGRPPQLPPRQRAGGEENRHDGEGDQDGGADRSGALDVHERAERGPTLRHDRVPPGTQRRGHTETDLDGPVRPRRRGAGDESGQGDGRRSPRDAAGARDP